MKSLSESQIKKFKDEGFLRIDNVISKEEFTLIRSKYDNLFIESSSEGLLKKKLGGIDSSGRDTLQQVIGVSVSNPNFAKLEYRKNITKIARLLIGDSANFRNDHAILKPAKYGSSTPWHQDQAYHDPRFLYKSVNFWLPLQEATVESGCMWYVPSTHKGTVVPHQYLDRYVLGNILRTSYLKVLCQTLLYHPIIQAHAKFGYDSFPNTPHQLRRFFYSS